MFVGQCCFLLLFVVCGLSLSVGCFVVRCDCVFCCVLFVVCCLLFIVCCLLFVLGC